ncbi:MAG: TonB-dependent receptor [Oleiphilaceae bacterium]|nr:TonB-dependent receptor [Oleiphilaceae bacterium]
MSFSRAATAKLFLTVPLIFLPLATGLAQAAEPSTERLTEAEPATLDPIVVTATLGPRTAGESLSSVTIIDEEDIRRQNARELKDLLRGQPGLDLSTNGSFGKNTSVFTRGTGSDATVLLVDGIRLRSATTGAPAWQFLSPQLLERIEIVRGPKSSLYGADAVGGVIQAFTMKADDEPEGWIEAGAGNFDSQQVGAGVAGREGRNAYSFAVNRFETDGTAIIPDGDDKGYRNTSGVARLSHDFDNGGQASLLLMRAQGDTEFEGGESDFVIQTLGAKLDTLPTDYWRSSVQFSESRDELDSVRSFGPSTFDTRTRTARWDNTLTAGNHEFVVGFEHLTDEVSGTTDYEEDSRTNNAIFTQALFNFGPTDLLFSLRGDDNEAYGQETTEGVAIGYALDSNHRARASYATAFKAPSFNDLYFPGFGNPDLKPERAETVEFGVSGRYQVWFWDLAIYQSDIDDLSITDGQSAQSVPEARIRGVEFGAGLDINDWSVKTALAYTDPKERNDDTVLRRRSRQSLRLDVDRDLGAWSLGASLVAKGHRYDDEENNERIPGFATLDLRAGWAFARDWTAQLTVENVTDKTYSTANRFVFGGDDEPYISAGTTGFLSVRHDFR